MFHNDCNHPCYLNFQNTTSPTSSYIQIISPAPLCLLVNVESVCHIHTCIQLMYASLQLKFVVLNFTF